MRKLHVRKVFPFFFFLLTLYVLRAVLPCEQFTSNPIIFTKKMRGHCSAFSWINFHRGCKKYMWANLGWSEILEENPLI